MNIRSVSHPETMEGGRHPAGDAETLSNLMTSMTVATSKR
jgi:hypothetical protein